ncbi:MAG: DJ-1/PfpI family protein [Planctomycetaceae bacterium]|nr:DJ-1/PfpI family protein [Planctomycetaceae bacterium]
MLRISLLMLTILTIAESVGAAEPEWQSLMPVIRPADDTVAGNWQVREGELTVQAANGARLSLPVTPPPEYDFRVTFTRHTGVHSIALAFVHGGKQATFEVDAWGQHLAGIQQVGGQDLRQNKTQKPNQTLTNGRKYTMLVEVRRNRVRTFLDGELIARLDSDGSDLSMPSVWQLPKANQLGLGAWDAQTTFHSVEVRPAGDSPIAMVRASTPQPTPRPQPSPPKPATSNSARGKKVLMVIANQDFFYREYGDPRAELERAGVQVVVAAGRKAPCRPHGGSGQGTDGGVVQPDVAIADVKAADYDAILFSGGWGASSYQYAFNGRYSNAGYNGDRAIKADVNRVINEFIAQDKYVCALCNGVSILAWARVDGQSPLRGKTVCAPVREAPVGVYNGRQGQPSCRWHPEVNGARMSPPGSIGNPGTNTDDVVVDGKIITGEDDPSAREMGRRIVSVLGAK